MINEAKKDWKFFRKMVKVIAMMRYLGGERVKAMILKKKTEP